MSENLIDDKLRHGITSLAAKINDPYIDATAAIRIVDEHEGNLRAYDARKREEALAAKEKEANEIKASDFGDLIADIKSKVDGEYDSPSNIIDRQHKAAEALKKATSQMEQHTLREE